MDNAVALVRTYLQLNGYFTVTEYPVMARAGSHQFRSMTDIDVMGFRFAGAGEMLVDSAPQLDGGTDSALCCSTHAPEMLIGEVKEGRAELNGAARDPRVLEAVLARFGCCSAAEAHHVAAELAGRGKASTACGHDVRLVAFGSSLDGSASYTRVLLSDVVAYIQEYVREHWDVVRHAGSKDAVFGMFVLMGKATEAAWRRPQAQAR